MIFRDQVKELKASGAQLVEVLGEEEYRHEHLAGAVNIPLRQLEERSKELDRRRPVIVYCNDFL